MCVLKSSFVDEIAQTCINEYAKLPKTGKPTTNEWTVLSCIVQYDCVKQNFEVVSLGTGSKCIGASKMSSSGVILNDSHAEVIARRGFLLYLYDNIEKAINNKQSILIKENNQFKLLENLEFVLFSSQLPCGDASIMLKCDDPIDYGDILYANKREAENNICDTKAKKAKTQNMPDIHRTGAKCLDTAEQDLKHPGVNYHIVGQVRTKPGRGDKTLSVSCSDKIARWAHLGIEGSLLNMLLKEPILIKQFIFGGDVPFSIESLRRALLLRSTENVLKETLKFYQSNLSFEARRHGDRIRPTPCSILWINRLSLLEVAVQGKKLGVTKKDNQSASSSLSISKLNLYRKFTQTLEQDDKMRKEILDELNIHEMPYNSMKRLNKTYTEQWNDLKHKFFKVWTVKPDIWNFCTEKEIRILRPTCSILLTQALTPG